MNLWAGTFDVAQDDWKKLQTFFCWKSPQATAHRTWKFSSAGWPKWSNTDLFRHRAGIAFLNYDATEKKKQALVLQIQEVSYGRRRCVRSPWRLKEWETVLRNTRSAHNMVESGNSEMTTGVCTFSQSAQRLIFFQCSIYFIYVYILGRVFMCVRFYA